MCLWTEVLLSHHIMAFREELLALGTSHSIHSLGFGIAEIVVVFLCLLLVDSLSNLVLPEVPHTHDQDGAHQSERKIRPSSGIFSRFLPGVDCMRLNETWRACRCQWDRDAFD